MNKFVPTVLSALVLGACGGGGGSTPTPAPGPETLSINTTNMEDVALNVYSSSDMSVLQGSALSASVITQTNGKFSIKDFVTAQVEEAMQESFSPQIASGAVTTNAKNCLFSGTVTNTLNDADGSLTTTSGDSRKLVYNNCQQISGGVSFNGEFNIIFKNLTGTGTSGTDWRRAYDVASTNMTYNVPSVGSILTNGTIVVDIVSTAAAGTRTSTFGMPAFTLSLGTNSISYSNYVNTQVVTTASGAFSNSLQGTVTESALGGPVSFVTLAPFQGVPIRATATTPANSNPSSGKLKITGNNSTLFLTVLDNNYVNLQLDSNNDGVIDSTKQIPWSAL